MEITIVVNGEQRHAEVAEDQSLLEVLRDELGVTGPKFGCGEGTCGACTVLLGRRAVVACRTPVGEAAGARVTTVEGLAEEGLLHPVQQAWLEAGALQCGYCTPGWVTATAALLVEHPDPSDEQIAAALDGHVCRCCTYPRIRRAIRRAAELMHQPETLAPVPPCMLPDPSQTATPPLPWDRSTKDAAAFFTRLPDGLVVVANVDDRGEPATGPGFRTSVDAWVHVGADGAVTAFTGKVEAGQGTRTALSLLVSEEMAVPVERVRLVMGDTGVSPHDRGTFGSRSMPDAAPRLREAAAAARETLRRLAGERFAMDPSDLRVADGMIAGPDGAPLVGYGELVTGMRRIERTGPQAPITDAASWRTAGQHSRTLGSVDAVIGVKRFPSDIIRPGMLHGCVVRPPAYRATLRRVDTSQAEAMPGVTVVHDSDIIGVVAGRASLARRAAAAIRTEWERSAQPNPADLMSYLRSHPVDGDGWLRPYRHEQGDVDAALADAAIRLDATYTTAYIAHTPLEPRVAVAEWHDDQVTVWVGTQTPFATRAGVADALGIPETSVHVIVPDFGGGFGGKHGAVVATEAARLARAVGRPVKVAWDRAEEFTWGYFRPAAIIDVAAGADRSGTLTAWSFTNINSGHAGIGCPYRVPHQRIVYQPADSPLPQGSYRALAATANTFARESHLDDLARRLGEDPVAFRLRHIDDERLAAVVRAAVDRITATASDIPARDAAGGEPGRTGVGVACGTEKGSYVATGAQVHVADDGTLRVRRLVTVFECGAIVNPDGLTNQVEGATVMALGGALFEQIDFADGQIRNASLDRYRVPRITDVPEVEAVLLNRPDLAPAGGGETPMIAVAPAIANAITDAIGVRLRSLPMAPTGKIPGVAAGQ